MNFDSSPRSLVFRPVRMALASATVLLAVVAASSCDHAAPSAMSGSAPATDPSAAAAPAPAPAPAPAAPPDTHDFTAVSKVMNDAITAHRLPGGVVVIGHGGRV